MSDSRSRTLILSVLFISSIFAFSSALDSVEAEPVQVCCDNASVVDLFL